MLGCGRPRQELLIRMAIHSHRHGSGGGFMRGGVVALPSPSILRSNCCRTRAIISPSTFEGGDLFGQLHEKLLIGGRVARCYI